MGAISHSLNQNTENDMSIELEAGKTYLVTHERKGTFGFKVENVGPEWAYGHVASGSAMAMLSYNTRHVGEEISVRRDMIRKAVLQS